MKKFEASTELTLEEIVLKDECERDHLFFTRYFFKKRQNIKFLVNWHHRLLSDIVQDIIEGKTKNVVINVPPGSSKTEMIVINLICRGLALNPYARFLHLSYSDDLALLNSQTSRDLIRSEEFQRFWPMRISDDSSSKKRWNVEVDGKPAGGVYATSLSGQITGFRAGHMSPGFQGLIAIDDPLKPEDAFSKPKMAAANRKLLTTVKSRKANPDTPIILIMQRIAENDPAGFIKNGNLPGEWKHVVIPAVIDQAYINTLEPKYRKLIEVDPDRDRFSYWPYKENIDELLTMERGDGVDQTGGRVSRHVFASQYQQNPVAMGGNLLKGQDFVRYKMLPKILYRNIFVDSALKAGEMNDFSVFECWGLGEDKKIYLIDLLRGKWESPELRKRAVNFWNKHEMANVDPNLGQLRRMYVEEKASGFDIIQSLTQVNGLPVFPIQRNRDKLSRVNDALPYIEAGMVAIPEESPWVLDFVAECESFSAEGGHKNDDQIDPLLDAIMQMLSSHNKIAIWTKLGST